MATIPGTAGDDSLTGTPDPDTIDALAGDDRLDGRAGDDELLGGPGSDLLVGGAGIDTIDGGAGVDRVSYAGIAADQYGLGVFATLETGRVQSEVAGDDVLTGVEDVTGTDHDDYLIGGFGPSAVAGGGGSDYLFGFGGSDTVNGGAGNDDINGDYQLADEAYNTETGGPASPGGADRLLGGAGDDEIEGDEGDDFLFGAGGADLLQGDLGSDTLRGGAGRDEFYYLSAPGSQTNRTENGLDLIEDFADGKDQILFIVDNLSGDALSAFEDPSSGLIDLDSNGNEVLDDGDLYVEIEAVTHDGVTRQSTVIDTADFADFDQGEHTLTVFGATGLTSADFSY